MSRHRLKGFNAVLGTGLSVSLAVLTNLVTGGTLAPWRSPGWLVFAVLFLGVLIYTLDQGRRQARSDSQRPDANASLVTAVEHTAANAFVAAGNLYVQGTGLHAATASPGRVKSPYPGLEAFTEQDAEVYFGREQEIQRLLERLPPAASDQACRFVAVVGPSGSGKSSLVHAGLVPHLAQQSDRWMVVPSFIPEDQPFQNLSHSVSTLLEDRRAEALARKLRKHPDHLRRKLNALRGRYGGRGTRVLLVLDQAEELFTHTTPGERKAFLSLLATAIRQAPWLWVVATLRSDFLTDFLQEDSGIQLNEMVAIGVLDRAALTEVIERPATLRGARFDPPSLVGRIAEDTGGGDALPLLAYTLQRLWLASGSSGVLSTAAYERLGGVAGTLAGQAGRAADELLAADPNAPVLPTMLKLVVLQHDTATRRRVRLANLREAERRVIHAFVNSRLLTSHTHGNDVVIQVAHEALFRQWAPLRAEIEARADALRQGARIEQWLQEWIEAGRDDAFLLSGRRLRAAKAWVESNADLAVQLPRLAEYLELSSRRDGLANENASAVLGNKALEIAYDQPELAMLVSLEAIERYGSTPAATLALSTAMVNEVGDVAADLTVDAYQVPISSNGPPRFFAHDSERQYEIHGGAPSLAGLAWSPDGSLIATGACLWDAHTGTKVNELPVNWPRPCAAWSPGWDRIAVADMEEGIRVWRLDDWRSLSLGQIKAVEERRLHWPDSSGSRRAQQLVWSPDGARLLAVTCGVSGLDGSERPVADLNVFVWSCLTGELIFERVDAGNVRLHRYSGRGAWHASWHSNSRYLALMYGPGERIEVWDLVAKERIRVPVFRRSHVSGGIRRAQFFTWPPDGRHYLALFRSTLEIGTFPEGRVTMKLHREMPRDGYVDARSIVAYSPNGDQIASFSPSSGILEVWDAARGGRMLALSTHRVDPARPWSGPLIAWSPDGSRIATTAWDLRGQRQAPTHVWDISRTSELLAAKARVNVKRELTRSERGRFDLDS